MHILSYPKISAGANSQMWRLLGQLCPYGNRVKPVRPSPVAESPSPARDELHCCAQAAAAAAAGGAAAPPIAAAAAPVSGAAAPPVSGAAAPPPLRPRDGVPAARGGVAVASLPQRGRILLGEAAPPLGLPSSEESSASAPSLAVERTGVSAKALSGGVGTDHSTSQPNNNWISRSRSVFKFCNAACDCGECSIFCNSRWRSMYCVL